MLKIPYHIIDFNKYYALIRLARQSLQLNTILANSPFAWGHGIHNVPTYYIERKYIIKIFDITLDSDNREGAT